MSKWGNGLGVRIPLALARQIGIGERDCLSLTLERGGIVMRPARRKYALAELVSRITPKNRHRETAWGPPQGEESW